jgi:spore maturation protein CgeB
MSANPRLLVVLPLYGGSLPVGRYCAKALRELGHVVEVFEAPDFHGAYTAFKGLRIAGERREHLENSYLQLLSQAVLAKVETFAPDLVLALAQAPLSRGALNRLRRDGVTTAMWFVEDFRLFTYWRAYAPLYDIFAVIQKDPFFQELTAIGQPNALYLPLAADPEFHCPVELSPAEQREFGADVSFLGAGYPNRRLAFRQLLHLDFKLWGSDWEGESMLAPRLQRQGRRIAPDEAVKIFNATRVNLNLHSSVTPGAVVTRGDFVNPRTFELASCAAFQLVDRRNLLPELFAEDELAVFSSMQELREMIERFLHGPEAAAERAAMAARARERVLREHTYGHRMRTLLDFVRARVENWPKARGDAVAALEVLPEDVRQEVRALLTRLRLPEDAGFEDLVWALRQQQGKLSEIETAIVFLDAWRKQYAGG